VNSRCRFCGKPVDPLDRLTWRLVSSAWTRGAVSQSRRGGRDVALVETVEVFAHPHCVRREQQGLSVAQESLL